MGGWRGRCISSPLCIWSTSTSFQAICWTPRCVTPDTTLTCLSHCSAFTQKVGCSSVSTPVQHHSAAVAGLSGSGSSHSCSGCYEMATRTFSPAILLPALPHRSVHVMAPRGLVASPIYYLITTLLGDHRKRFRVWARLVFSRFKCINFISFISGGSF